MEGSKAKVERSSRSSSSDVDNAAKLGKVCFELLLCYELLCVVVVKVCGDLML